MTNQRNDEKKRETQKPLVNDGRQGVDKAPGEDPAIGKENVVAETQKGKNKVDGDPSQPADQPIDQP